MNSMDKRSSTRYAVSLNALVHPNEGRSWLCMVKDYCESGMLLVAQEGARKRRSMPGIIEGETVGIHFSVPLESKDQHFRLEGEIVRVMDSGVGIRFLEGMASDAMDALDSYSDKIPAAPPPEPKDSKNKGAKTAAKSAASKKAPGNLSLNKSSDTAFLTGGLKPADSRKIVAAMRKGITRVLPEMTNALFKFMDAELLDLAKTSRSNAEQSEYFAAMAKLEKSKVAVGKQFADEVLDHLDNPRDLKTLLEERKKANEDRKQASAAKRVKLSLVNTEEFEDWLAVANIVSKSDRVYEAYMKELTARMGMMVDSWGHIEANPLGSSVFCHSFDNAIQGVTLSKEIRQMVYTGYEVAIVPVFRKLYVAAVKLLEDTGLFPDLDDDYISPGTLGSSASEEDPPEEVESASEDSNEEDENFEEDKVEAKEKSEEQELADLQDDLRKELEHRKTERNKSSGRKEASSAQRARGGSNTSGRARETAQGVSEESKISRLYSTVRDLLGAGQGFYEEEGYSDDQFVDQKHVEIKEMQGLLRNLRQEIGSSPAQRVPIRQRVMDSAVVDGHPRRLAPEAMQRLDVVEKLVDSIEDDSMLSGSSKGWIRQLELTLGKVASQHDDFLGEESSHRSLDVLNHLAELGGSESNTIKRSVEDIIGNINDNFDSDPAVFDSALEKLQPLVDRQSRAFTGNVQRTVKASEGQQTLINAQRAVVDEMDQKLAGREVPEVLMKLLMPGWRNLLVNTHLRQGQGSSAWKGHVRALDQVMEHLDESVDAKQSPDYIPPEELLQQIESGLESISFEPGQRAPLVNTLRQLLTTDEGRSSLPMVRVEEQSVAETLGFSSISEPEEKRRKIQEKHENNPGWNRLLDQAQHLHVGEWVEFLLEGKEADIAIVAWVSEDNSKLVFVNRRGVKTYELSSEELANSLAEGTARILDESDIPLTDRASHRMLQNMHNKLTHQATHDELTGLINRKEFEREIERILGLAKHNKTQHVVAFMDLDQFKVVNNTGGHDAGDRLLVELSEELSSKAEENTILSRLGGDEFGILLEDCGTEVGMEAVKRICETVKDFRFSWEEEVYSLTTSCGVVNVDSETESVTGILRGADSACYVAKDAGRDRIQVYQIDDSDMEHRKEIMEFVSQIDNSLANDRFVLNCQKIAPIDKDGEDHDHYEILLTVLDEDDKPLPPQDFIVAAETYNRMGAIDRWVIKNSFKFIASNILKLDHLGAFSINISGNSLTEDDFMEFVLEQFKETRLPTSKVCFEITETAAIGNLDQVIEFMEKMKVLGVQFSLDDFGTGLSSYSYLRNLPVDFLKIDGVFVKDIKNNPNDYAVVKSINEIGHFMGKKTIAEFVENDEILEILQEIGVDFAQGYGVGMKVPITELL
jgi:diguanylate cyclase (GGDEF)-like protein